jgi:glycosyltransferase involved in cell wall biosynthesis
MNILFLTRYSSDAPSSRYRCYQYIPIFEKYGIKCDVSSLMELGYVEGLNKNKRSKTFQLISLYLARFYFLLKVRNYDFVFIQKELFPYFPSLFEHLLKITNTKYIVDYDDAIFHVYDENNNGFVRYFLKKKIANVIAHSKYTITGSPYLTNYAKSFNKYVEEIPTSIDIDKYPITKSSLDSNFVIGWIGSKTTSKHILSIIEALRLFSNSHKCIIRLIGFDKSLLIHFDNMPVEVVTWSEKEEVNTIKTFSVGIMPLNDTPFERGKCGFKLVQYMACCIPTISTPLEANVKINRDSQNLFANNTSEWNTALESVYNNRAEYANIGMKNRNIVEKYYCIQANIDKYINIFNNIVNPKDEQ